MGAAETYSDLLVADTLNALKRQEESCYFTKKGLYDDETKPVSRESRRLMIQWCLRIADYCHYRHNTITVAINILDRCIEASPDILESTRKFQLAVMTSLYIAVKSQERVVMDSDTLATLSKGFYTAKDLERFELFLLAKLKWRINAPTVAVFADLFVKLLLPAMIRSNEKLLKHTTNLIQNEVHQALINCDCLGTSVCDLAYQATVRAISVVDCRGATRQHRLGRRLVSPTLMSARIIKSQSKKKKTQEEGGGASRSLRRSQSMPSRSSSLVHLSPRTVTMKVTL